MSTENVLAGLDFLAASGTATERDRRNRVRLRTGRSTVTKGRSLGDRAVGSVEFAELQLKSESVPLSGDIPLATVAGAETKALLAAGSSTSVGAFLTAQTDAAAPVPARPLSALSLVRQGEMTSDSVTFARQSTYTPVAAATAEAVSTGTGTKPEATAAFAITTATAASYASWAPVTRRSLADAAEIRALVDERLLQDARQALETALLATVNTDAGQTQARSTDAHSLAILKGLTLLRTADSKPSAIVVTPSTYEATRSATTTQYLAGDPVTVDSAGEKWWGVPVIVSASAPATVALVANWNQAAAVWYRGADVFLSDSHDTGFVKNISTVLAELRAAHATLAPRHVVKITGM